MRADSGKRAHAAATWPAGASLALFALSFAIYALTAAPAIGWLDSPEFVAQSLSLGAAHSPGHPLYGLLGYLASLLPVGDRVWRINLLSGACAAGSVSLLFLCAHVLIARIAPRVSARSCLWMAMSIALFAGASWALWSNAVRAEVYALQALLSTGALLALLHYEDTQATRHLLVASLVLALGLANHHLLTLTILVPGALFVFWRERRPGLRVAAMSAGVGMLGLCALVYLPVRSLRHPLVNFGAPHTLERFFWTLRGAAFAKSAQEAHVSTPLMDTVQVLDAVVDALSLPLLLLAIFAIYLGCRVAAQRRLTLFLAAIAIITIAVRVLLGFDPETPDHHAYLLPALLSLWLLAIAGIAQLCSLAVSARRPLRAAPALCALALALMVPIQLFGEWPRTSQRSNVAADEMAHWSIDALPANSLVLIAYHQTRFRLWALQAVEGARPDVSIIDRSFLTYPGMAGEAKHFYPELAALIDSPLRAGEPSPMPLLHELAKERPVYAELHPNLDLDLARALQPAGAFARLDAPANMHDTERAARRQLAALFADASLSERDDTRAALLWYDATTLDELCILGDKDRAREVLADALQLAASDQMLLEMASACGLSVP